MLAIQSSCERFETHRNCNTCLKMPTAEGLYAATPSKSPMQQLRHWLDKVELALVTKLKDSCDANPVLKMYMTSKTNQNCDHKVAQQFAAHRLASWIV